MDNLNINTPDKLWAQGYFSDEHVLDECLNSSSEVKDHWKRLINNIEKFDHAELKNREQELLKLLEENGVTYNVYGDPNGLNRPWALDIIPQVISTSEWQLIEKGLQQRAHVLNMLLEDIYGEKKLLKEGIIPAELIYAHSGFLRVCEGIKLPGKHQLFMYAADLSRGPDGKIWVLRDRTQAPSGMGYAVENRSALSRVIPEIFNGHHVSRLSGFFNSMMLAFQKIAPQGKEQPRIVILTPGPRNETYFEHAFIASYLGLTLVQGEDMLVRDGFIWIKTIEGLEKVDIILRRVDDSYCDPLELKEDSQLGIPGLLEVVRKGNVVVVNPLGSGILENAGLMAFMHSITRYYLNEDPIFPMVATWWCGQNKEMDYVIQHIDELVIKKIDRLTGSETTVGNMLSKNQKAELIRKIKAQPYLYVGQEALNISTSPVYKNEHVEPRYHVMRNFLVANQNHYEIMPGGLTRCSPEKGRLIVSNQEGGIAKDTWVEDSAKSLATFFKSQDLRRKAVLPSRAAENLFWVGRYAQRVVHTARFMRIVLRNLTQTGYLSNGQESESLLILLRTSAYLTDNYKDFFQDDEDPSLVNRVIDLHKLICREETTGSIVFTVNNLLKAMYSVRDKWSVDNWRIIDSMENIKRRLSIVEPQNLRHALSLLDELSIGINSFLEMNRQSMYREEGWVVYTTGQLIEDIALSLTKYRSLLTFEFDENTQYNILESLLVSTQSLTNYRSVYKTYLDIKPVIDLLFLNEHNPISLISQFSQLISLLEQLPQKSKDVVDRDLSNIAFECYSKVRLISIENLIHIQEETGVREQLDMFCAELSNKVYGLATKLNAHYFIHSIYRHQGARDNDQFEI